MTLKEQLSAGDKIFSRIDEFVKKNDYKSAYEIIQTENPPDCWIIELDSLLRKGEKFKTIKLELMEAIIKRIFGNGYIRTIEQPIIIQDKVGNISVTIVVKYEVRYLEDTKPYPLVLAGVATETVSSMKLLPLATPKASSMALKNALKQVGRLLGKHLNSEAEELELPCEPIEKKMSPEEELLVITEGILSAKNVQDLKSWRSLVYSKKNEEQQNLYETRLRSLQTENN
jgi:hypothetical protein